MGFEERGKALEEAFFAKKNKELLEQVKQDLDATSQRAALVAATGIREDDLLDRLLAIGINTESLTAMSIVPMVLVAWADGKIDAKERAAILSGADKSGIKPDTLAAKLLEGWLSDQPDDSLAAAWKDYMQAVCGKLAAGDKVKLQEEVIGRSKSVAEAAGGFLGLGSISTQEQRVLDSLNAAFK